MHKQNKTKQQQQQQQNKKPVANRFLAQSYPSNISRQIF